MQVRRLQLLVVDVDAPCTQVACQVVELDGCDLGDLLLDDRRRGPIQPHLLDVTGHRDDATLLILGVDLNRHMRQQHAALAPLLDEPDVVHIARGRLTPGDPAGLRADVELGVGSDTTDHDGCLARSRSSADRRVIRRTGRRFDRPGDDRRSYDAAATMARLVHLLDLDPDLAQGMDSARERVARQHLLVRFERVDAGPWTPSADVFEAQGGLGLLLTDGLAVRRVSLGRRAAAELLGPGDVLRPWEDDGEHAAYPFSASFRVVEPLALAILDERVAGRLMHFPEIVGQLMGRVMARSRRVVGHLVIAQLTSMDARLHIALWHMADRFGRVRPDGVFVPLHLTHEVIGHIVGARRPSVTAALGRLTEQGLIEPQHNGGWLLKGDPPEAPDDAGAFR